mgnify:CR=1 FL=1
MLTWILTTALLTAPPPLGGDPLSPYRGQPVVSVELEAPPNEDVNSLRSLINIEPGYLLSTQNLQASIKRLYALGRFAAVNVYAKRISGSVQLRFVLESQTRLAELHIEGLERAAAGPLRDALEVRVGQEIDRGTLQAMEARATRHLEQAGFPEARAEVGIAERSQTGAASLSVQIEEGDPQIVGEIRFIGNPRVPRPLLDELVRTEPGDILNEQRLARDRERLRKAYRKKGFLAARIYAPRIQRVGGKARVALPIDAGKRIAVRFVGNQSLADATLAQAWRGSSQAIDPDNPDELARRLEQIYVNRGRPDTRVEVRRMRRAERPGVLYLVCRIREGPRVFVDDILFEGATVFPQSVLRSQLRARLRAELGDSGLLAPIDAGTLNRAWHLPDASVPPVPIGQRLVPRIYARTLEEITAAYRDRGYLSARVGPAETERRGNRVQVRIPVREGPQTRIDSVSFRGNRVVAAKELLDVLSQSRRPAANGGNEAPPAMPGRPYSPNAVEDGRIALLRAYRDRGYLYARVFTETQFFEERKRVALVYRFEEGPQVTLRNVLVRGNRYTAESLIRSRMTLAPGDRYRLEQALEDQRRIASLGVFSSVRVRLIDEETPGELKDLVAEVEERNRQPVDLTLGLSTADGPRLRLSYSHINVFGTASTFSSALKLNRKVFFGLYGEFGDEFRDRYQQFNALDQLERELRLGLRSPRILGLPLDPSFRLDLVQERENAIPYSLDSFTGIFGADLQLSDTLTVAIEPQVSLTGLRCEELEGPQSQRDCLGAVRERRPTQGRLNAGLKRTFEVGPRLVWDGRDDPFNPQSGFFLNSRIIYALGSTRNPDDTPSGLDLFGRSEAWNPFSFAKMETTLTGYFSLRDVTLAVSLRGGFVRVFPDGDAGGFSPAPIDERFFLGGRGTLRGYLENTLIPEDVCVVPPGATDFPERCNDVIVSSPSTGGSPVSRGGHSYLLVKSELRVPFGNQFSVGFFLDAGNLWFQYPTLETLRPRYGLGAGIRYNTPVGPMALDIGVNPTPRPQKAETSWLPHFSIGVF